MSNSIATAPIPISEPAPATPPDFAAECKKWEQRCAAAIAESDRLRAELAKTQQERDAYKKTVYHFMCKDYVPPAFTKEEVLAHLDDKPTFHDLIAELNCEYAQEK